MKFPIPSIVTWISFLGASLCFSEEAASPARDDSHLLWWNKPAEKWEEAAPIGNGRLGAMVFGRVDHERIQLNEGTLWAGGPYNPVNPEAKDALPEARRLVNEGKYGDASRLIDEKIIAKPRGQMQYETVGDLQLNFPGSPDFGDYRRELNLDDATATVSYVSGGVRFTREMFASAPDNVIVVRLSADKPGRLSFSADMKTPMNAKVETDGKDTLVMTGVGDDSGGVQGKIQYQARVKVMATGGKLAAEGDHVTVTNADQAILLVTAATNYKKFDDLSGDPEGITRKRIATAGGKSFASLRSAHLADYQPLFRRVSIDLGKTDAMKLPTDERIRHFAEGNDPQLASL